MVARRLLVGEALLFLLLARLALHVVPYRWLTWYLSRPVREPQVTGERRAYIRQGIVWSLLRAARYLPGETVCFPRGIAAQAMLRRRRVGTTLYYGVTSQPDRRWRSHVWVMDGAEGVVGAYGADQYHVLARYPELSNLSQS